MKRKQNKFQCEQGVHTKRANRCIAFLDSEDDNSIETNKKVSTPDINLLNICKIIVEEGCNGWIVGGCQQISEVG